jgi:hypothetical protein
MSRTTNFASRHRNDTVWLQRTTLTVVATAARDRSELVTFFVRPDYQGRGAMIKTNLDLDSAG